MSRSKLEKYMSILGALVSQPLKHEEISKETKIEHKILKKYLGFLILHKLIKENSSDKGRITYAITDIGFTVLKRIEAQKYFEKLKNILYSKACISKLA